MSTAFLSVRQFANREGLTIDAVYRRIYSQRLSAVKVGRTWRIPVDDTDPPDSTLLRGSSLMFPKKSSGCEQVSRQTVACSLNDLHVTQIRWHDTKRRNRHDFTLHEESNRGEALQ